MKKVTYQGKLYTVEDIHCDYYKLSGIGWRAKNECSHWIYGLFYKIFGVKWKGEMK